MRKIFVLGAALMLSVAFAAPVLADEPIEDTFSFSYPAENPCTGLEHEVTMNVVLEIHEHGHNLVLLIKNWGNTDDGFVMHGVGHVVDSEIVEGTGIFHDGGTEVWRNHSTGEAFILHFNFVFEASTDTVRVDNFSVRCLGS